MEANGNPVDTLKLCIDAEMDKLTTLQSAAESCRETMNALEKRIEESERALDDLQSILLTITLRLEIKPHDTGQIL